MRVGGEDAQADQAAGADQSLTSAGVQATSSSSAACGKPSWAQVRARETCELLGFHDAESDDRWREADLGAWTGLHTTSLDDRQAADYARWRAGELDPPGAEPFAAMTERVQASVDELRAKGASTLVVTHGGPIRSVCQRLLGLEPRHVVPVHPGSLTVLDLEGSPRLAAYNLRLDTRVDEAPD